MKVHCPKCHHAIPASKMNVETNVAVCPTCDEAFDLSDLLSDESENGDESKAAPHLKQAPPGAWFTTDVDSWQVGASTRSGAAFFLVPFMLVWSGFSLGGIYGSQIVAGKFNLMMSLFWTTVRWRHVVIRIDRVDDDLRQSHGDGTRR